MSQPSMPDVPSTVDAIIIVANSHFPPEQIFKKSARYEDSRMVPTEA